MPTYQNTTSKRLDIGDKIVKPSEIIKTYKYLNVDGLTMISEDPYYNPVILLESVTFVGAETKEVIVPRPEIDLECVVKDTTVKVTIYLNSITNTPPALILNAGEIGQVSLKGCVGKLIIESEGAGSCSVILIQNEFVDI